MSDSELSEASATPAPPDADLERCLRREIIRATKAGEECTVRSVRTAAEKKLGLSLGWYKDHADWNAKSKAIIHEQIETEADIPASPVKPLKSQAKPKKITSPVPVKRASQGGARPARKKQKTESDASSEALSSSLSELSSASESDVKPKKSKKSAQLAKGKAKPPVPKKQSSKKTKSEPAKADDEDHPDTEPEAANGGSDSEMSMVYDEEPPLKTKRKSKDPPDARPKPKSAKPKTNTDEDPEQAEIKRLQGWLVKCGIRKVWGKELKPYDSQRAKIKHLKDMLSDAGMTGRFSIEKANQIKEARELAADIEAVKEGAERWGTADGDEEVDSGKPGRRLVRGAKNYDFLSSDGEETD